jgi:hypothetical protein
MVTLNVNGKLYVLKLKATSAEKYLAPVSSRYPEASKIGTRVRPYNEAGHRTQLSRSNLSRQIRTSGIPTLHHSQFSIAMH